MVDLIMIKIIFEKFIQKNNYIERSICYIKG